MIHELGYWDKSVFITLTYSDEYLPPNSSLRKTDLQKFFKRLRKNLLGRKIKYYACGEYGSRTNRPHYHAIIFGLGSNPQDRELIKDSWRFCEWSNFSNAKAFGTVTYDSCRYVSDYIFKKYSGQLADDVYISKGLEIPFKVCSQGLGLRYCLSEKNNLVSNFGFTLRGQKMALPRYYVEKLGLKLQDQNEANFNKWLNYSKQKDIPLEDIADEIVNQARQRAETTEARINLRKKGKF